QGKTGDKGGGGGLFVSNTSTVTIQDQNTTHSVISCNQVNGTQGGGGILISSLVTKLTITDAMIFRNLASGGDGGGLKTGRANANLTNVVIEFNTAKHGGGIFHPANATDTLTHCQVAGNTATTGVGPDLDGVF